MKVHRGAPVAPVSPRTAGAATETSARGTRPPHAFHHRALHELLGRHLAIAWCLTASAPDHLPPPPTAALPSLRPASSTAWEDGVTSLAGCPACPARRPACPARRPAEPPRRSRSRRRGRPPPSPAAGAADEDPAARWAQRTRELQRCIDDAAHGETSPLRWLRPHWSPACVAYAAWLGITDGWTSYGLLAGRARETAAAAAAAPFAVICRPLVSFCLPALQSIREVLSAARLAELRAGLPPRGAADEDHGGPPPGTDARRIRFFHWITRVGLRRRRWMDSPAPEKLPCACDVYLLLHTDVAPPGELTVWGRAPRRGATSSPRRLFYIARRVEDYFRLGASFAWVYGWQLCFSAAGPPIGSLPWLRSLNAPALAAAGRLVSPDVDVHAGSRRDSSAKREIASADGAEHAPPS